MRLWSSFWNLFTSAPLKQQVAIPMMPHCFCGSAAIHLLCGFNSFFFKLSKFNQSEKNDLLLLWPVVWSEWLSWFDFEGLCVWHHKPHLPDMFHSKTEVLKRLDNRPEVRLCVRRSKLINNLLSTRDLRVLNISCFSEKNHCSESHSQALDTDWNTA